MLAERLHPQETEVPLAALDLDRIVLVEIELFRFVVEIGADRNLPVRRDPVGTDPASELPLALDSSPENDAYPRMLKTQWFHLSCVGAAARSAAPRRTMTDRFSRTLSATR